MPHPDSTSAAQIVGHNLITKAMCPLLTADVTRAASGRACSPKRGLLTQAALITHMA